MGTTAGRTGPGKDPLGWAEWAAPGVEIHLQILSQETGRQEEEGQACIQAVSFPSQACILGPILPMRVTGPWRCQKHSFRFSKEKSGPLPFHQFSQRPGLLSTTAKSRKGSSDAGKKTFLSSKGHASGQGKQRWSLTCSWTCFNSHSVSRAKVWRDRELGSGHTRTASSTTPQAPVRLCSQGVETLTYGKDIATGGLLCFPFSSSEMSPRSHWGPKLQGWFQRSSVPQPPKSSKDRGKSQFSFWLLEKYTKLFLIPDISDKHLFTVCILCAFSIISLQCYPVRYLQATNRHNFLSHLKRALP